MELNKITAAYEKVIKSVLMGSSVNVPHYSYFVKHVNTTVTLMRFQILSGGTLNGINIKAPFFIFLLLKICNSHISTVFII